MSTRSFHTCVVINLSPGEYVAVEKLEEVYKKTSLVEQIWVYGNSFESCLVAVVVPKAAALQVCLLSACRVAHGGHCCLNSPGGAGVGKGARQERRRCCAVRAARGKLVGAG